MNLSEGFSEEFLIVLVEAAEGETERVVGFLLTEVNASNLGRVFKFTKMLFKHVLPK